MAHGMLRSVLRRFPPRKVLAPIRRLAPDVLWYKDPSSRKLALTIDDAPSEDTDDILSVLEDHGVHATFFGITSRFPGNESVLRRIVDRGHELGNHMTEDSPSFRMSPEEFEGEFERAHRALAEFQADMRWFRPGHGLFSGEMVQTVSARGYRIVLGDVFPFDTHMDPTFCIHYILRFAMPGSIMILHDGMLRGRATNTCRILRAVLPVLRDQGYQISSVSDLMSD
jgi:peptidoglycan/xylan/chitin deacetylase (PgdA/CDA1 family)